jgi:DNA-binding response OmpR family regulator/HPt (histidine-containing phosphotransfer) domain-containing protein
LNPSTSQITYADRPLSLTTKEYELLELLLRESQHVLSAEEILDRLWSAAEFPSEATVRSHIRRIRRKLAAVGAPSDLIGTIHGRGYYLKPLEADVTEPSATGRGESADSYVPPPDAQQQYLTFLNQTWVTVQATSLQQTAVLQQMIQGLQRDRLTGLQQHQAKHVAHKLAGTLGIFGLVQAVELCRQLEHWFGNPIALSQQDVPALTALVVELQHQIEQTTTLSLSHLPGQPTARMLLVNLETDLAHVLTSIAAEHGIQTVVASSQLPKLDVWPPAQSTAQLPDIILLRIPSSCSITSVMPGLAQCYPSVPIVMLCDQCGFSDRLAAVRQGSPLFLDAAMSPQQVITCVRHFLQRSSRSAKVILVDDDQTWLSTLSALLQPWKFEITTLAEPQQFWAVLQTVTPDVVVMDALMPQITGFELCQIVRGDPYWQKLPILFLSALTDARSQQYAFTAGADDYLYKPIAGAELAQRILQRLERVRTLSAPN